MARSYRGSGAGRVSILAHFNQLALFTDNPVESTPEELAEVASDGNDRKDSAWRGDPQALAGELPADGAGSGEAESPGAGGFRGAGEDGRPALRTGVGEKDGLPGSVGTGNSGVGAATERGPSADGPAIVREVEIRDI